MGFNAGNLIRWYRDVETELLREIMGILADDLVGVIFLLFARRIHQKKLDASSLSHKFMV